MRIRCLGVSAVLALLCSGCDWLQWGGGPQHSGGVFETTLLTGNVSTLTAAPFAGMPATTSASVFGNLLFIEQDGLLRALDSSTSGVVWTGALPSGATAGGAPAVDAGSGTVFVTVSATPAPVIVGFDVDGVENCNQLSNTCSPTFWASLGTAAAAVSPPLVDGGKVFANGASALYAFDATGQTGCVPFHGAQICSALWSAPTGFSASGVGPVAANGVVYDAVTTVGYAVGAFDQASGSPLWLGLLGAAPPTATPSIAGDGTLFAPAQGTIQAFAGGGCGSATCPPAFTLAIKAGDAAGNFLATPTLDGGNAFATNTNGSLYRWPASGCGAGCRPNGSVAVNTAADPTYRQAITAGNGMLFVLARQSNRSRLLAFDAANLTQLKSLDLGVTGLAPGIASVSLASGVVYAPLTGAVVVAHLPPVQPLASLSTSPNTLSPGFAPWTFDYALRCAAGTNNVSFTMSAVAGGTVQLVAPVTTQPAPSRTDTVQLAEGQAAMIRATDAAGAAADYWVRCLPHDFPPITVTYPRPGGPTPGWYVLGDSVTPRGSASYAMILDFNGTPVWFRRSGPGPATNVTPTGHNRLAFMQVPLFGGYSNDPNGQFDDYDVGTGDSTAIRAVGTPTDFHELHKSANGHHYLLSYPLKSGVDLTGFTGTPTPGPNSTIVDCVVQEVNAQGAVVWQWTGSDHLDAATETTITPLDGASGTNVYDPFHCNSIDAKPNGDVLVSARHVNAIFEIRRSDGKIVWKMGGKPVNKDGATIVQIQNDPQNGIVQQHDARYLPNGNISLFDNQNPQTGFGARAVEYAVDVAAKAAHPVFSFVSPTNSPSCCQGSFRRYSDGHSVVGWGLVNTFDGRAFTELDEAGNAVLDLAFGSGYASYRAVKVPTTRFDIDVLRATAGQ